MKKSFGMKTDLIKNRIHSMTLKEKNRLLLRKEFLGNQGDEKISYSVCFLCAMALTVCGVRTSKKEMICWESISPGHLPVSPAAVTTASSWDPGLLEKIGEAIGREAKCYGVSLVLGPGANIKRNPLCGRNFEYFSEGPVFGRENGRRIYTRYRKRRYWLQFEAFCL